MFRPHPGDRLFTTGEAAALMAAPGVKAETASHQLRHWTQSNIIRPSEVRGSNPEKAARLYSIETVATAKVLSALMDIGVKDAKQATLRAAASACSIWSTDHPFEFVEGRRVAVTPIGAAILATSMGGAWALQLHAVRLRSTGKLFHRAYLLDPAAWQPTIKPDWSVRATIMVPLGELIVDLYERLNGPRAQ